MATAAEFTAWLGESVGEKSFTLPANVVTALEKAYADGTVEEDDIADDGTLDGGELKEAIDLWRDIYADGAKAKKLDVRASDGRKLARWLTVRWSTEEALDALDEGKPSKQLQEDMDAQGVTAPAHIGFIELDLASGRVPALAETVGFAHKAPWAKMDGGKLIIKYKQDNLDVMLTGGDLEEVNLHFSTLAERLMMEDEEYSHLLAARVLRHWQDARKLRASKAILFYMKAFRKKYAGRGLPTVTDRDLMTEAMSAQMAGDLGAQGKPMVDLGGVRLEGTSSKGTSHAGSSVPSSASSLESKLATQITEMMGVVTTLSQEMSSLKTGLNDLKSTQGNLASKIGGLSKSSGGGERKCFRCGSWEHEIKDCPEPPKGK
jgi:hypothetical protein